MGERYGKEVVGRIFKTARATGDLNRAFKAHTGLDLVELSKRWQDDARQRYLPKNVLLDKPDEIAKPLMEVCQDCNSINIVPSISPDGKKLVYVGNKNFTLNILLRNLETGKTSKIVRGGSSQSYEILRYFDTSMNWSPDSRFFTFVAKAGANDAIYIVDARRKKVVKKLSFEHLTGMAAPSWSPDGTRLIFSGLDGGISNLYVVDRDGSNFKQLTDDRYAYLHPQWSPDGKKIAFTTDRGPNTSIDDLIFGNYNIALYDMESGEVTLVTRTGGNHINPIWSADGSELYFISDMNGIPNIYSMKLDTGELFQISDLITGVSGIITESPAISLATETGRMAFSAFWNAGWYIYTMDEYEKHPIEGANVVAVLDTLENPNEKYHEYAMPDSSEFLLSDYKSKLSPDLIVGGGAFATNVGFAGQTAFLFSDMLGDKSLLVQAALFGDPLESTIIATYFNQKRRLNWAFTVFQFRDDFGLFTASNSAQVQSRIFRGVGVRAALPFSRFTRVEVGSNAFFVDRDFIEFNIITGQTLGVSSSNAVFGDVEASLIRDTAFWGFAAPVSGTRARFSVQQNFGDLNYSLLFGDYRKYIAISVPRYSIAYRLSGGVSYGSDRRRFFIGGPFTFRGVDFGELSGTRVVFQNIEFRFPVFPMLPMQYDFLTAVAFFDAAQAWGDNFDIIGQPINIPFRFSDTLTSYGLGIRFNLGGLLVLRWDFPLKKERGAPSTFFSIGLDY
ncbi:MAG: hypothetical protein D6743_03110 [Calditrichaeota bacterium]|nr:MAG: hypothetical protein D6743_03110 [Calditrichota bacterium]